MTNDKLQELLKMLPGSAEVVFIHDTCFVNDIRHVTYTQDGVIRLLSHSKDISGRPLKVLSAETK